MLHPEPLLQFRSWMVPKVNRMSIRFSKERKISIRHCLILQGDIGAPASFSSLTSPSPRAESLSSVNHLFPYSRFSLTTDSRADSPWTQTAKTMNPTNLASFKVDSYQLFCASYGKLANAITFIKSKTPNVFFFIWFSYLWVVTAFHNFNLKAVILESSLLRPPQDNVLGGVESQRPFGREASLTLWAQLSAKLCNLKILFLALENICLNIGIRCKSSVRNS